MIRFATKGRETPFRNSLGFILQFFSLVLIALLFVYFILNINPSRQGFVQSIDAILEVFIDYLSDVRAELQAELASHESQKVGASGDNDRLSDYKPACPHHSYTIRLVHRNPLIIYIDKFLTQNEIQHLIDLT